MPWNGGLLGWFRQLLSGRPHQVIGGDDPYLLRWYLIPRTGWINVYLHKFMRDDDDRALHDHPWWFVSLVIRGWYYERVHDRGIVSRFAGSIAFRRATHRHQVMLPREAGTDRPVPCWTIVVTGPRSRTWGFWCPQGFVPWTEFLDPNDENRAGKGCG